MFYDTISSPIGNLLLLSSDAGLKKIIFSDHQNNISPNLNWIKDSFKLKEVKDQLLAYFHQELTQFNLMLAPDGTAFQKSIWKELQQIPYGTICSYQDIANSIGKPNACRAVGMANSLNPIPIIIPCHRVIGKNGKLTGYAGGLETKAKLLIIENIQMPNDFTQFKLF
ncbi:methylated-DNA--[protein]-cysteine S-methyltransferase [Ancylomarina longa]|uniref:Methylated-DNA--protein-cysteine methyltransferase n=1 Tax=Ancylomarina longa TaxID=2487017 RepID=A0A434AZZ5_9BACT|nr:methylated-DNA--[protein]-cysteine S-methyltransferase [Ancylomarina longa]RUT80160.1 methylated-DNA--[protein]-cysteine S-methyltransferase [Ancylomarina longa]